MLTVEVLWCVPETFFSLFWNAPLAHENNAYSVLYYFIAHILQSYRPFFKENLLTPYTHIALNYKLLLN